MPIYVCGILLMLYLVDALPDCANVPKILRTMVDVCEERNGATPFSLCLLCHSRELNSLAATEPNRIGRIDPIDLNP